MHPIASNNFGPSTERWLLATDSPSLARLAWRRRIVSIGENGSGCHASSHRRYREPLNGVLQVARSLLLLYLNRSAWPCSASCLFMFCTPFWVALYILGGGEIVTLSDTPFFGEGPLISSFSRYCDAANTNSVCKLVLFLDNSQC